jgi:hypothetical protein
MIVNEENIDNYNRGNKSKHSTNNAFKGKTLLESQDDKRNKRKLVVLIIIKTTDTLLKIETIK